MGQHRLISDPEPRDRPGWVWLVGVVAWAGLIAASSSTVVLPRDLFGWVRSHLFSSEPAIRGFILFWGSCWFVVVKGWHVAEYALLTTMTLKVCDQIAASTPRRNVMFAFGFSILFAASDEYHQTFVPGRGGNWTDIVIDGVGCGLAALVALRRSRLQVDSAGRRSLDLIGDLRSDNPESTERSPPPVADRVE